MVSILATVERAIAAGATSTSTSAADNPWPAESYTSRRNPKQLALAEVKKQARSKKILCTPLKTREIQVVWQLAIASCSTS